MSMPTDLGERVHFYGVLETPNDLVKFFCNSYIMHDNTITIFDFVLDVSATHKAPFLQKGILYYTKIEIMGYMAVFTPYTTPKQMKGGDTP